MVFRVSPRRRNFLLPIRSAEIRWNERSRHVLAVERESAQVLSETLRPSGGLLCAMQDSAPNGVRLAAGFPRCRFRHGNSNFENQVLLEPRVANTEIADSPAA